MKVSHSKLKGCVIIEPRVFGDDRGFFLETFQAVRYEQEAGIDLPFVQDNHSRSARGLSLIHISEPTRPEPISYAVFCLKKKKTMATLSPP